MKLRSCAALLLGLAIGWPAHAHGAETLRVCLHADDPPRSERVGERGFDVDVMRQIAGRIGRSFEPVWIQTPPTMTEVEESDLPLADLVRGRCDALASVPGELALGSLAERIALSRPYYGAGFELVGPDSLPNDLRQLDNTRIGVRTVSVAHLVLESLGVEWAGRKTAAELLAALEAGEVGGALVWGPSLATLGGRPKDGWVPPAALRWNLHLATRGTDPLTAELDIAIGKLIRSGEITRLLESHGVPPHAPYPTFFSRATLEGLMNREVSLR